MDFRVRLRCNDGMIKLIKKSDYIKMPWKNGLGLTDQIALSDQWRLSSAQVDSSNPFSEFPGCDRLLTVFRGDGLALNGRPLHSGEVVAFPGEGPVQCELLGGPVKDLGLVYRRDHLMASMVPGVLHPQSEKTLHTPGETNFLFVTSGRLLLDEYEVETEDCLEVQGPVTLRATNPGPQDTRFVQITISRRHED